MRLFLHRNNYFSVDLALSTAVLRGNTCFFRQIWHLTGLLCVESRRSFNRFALSRTASYVTLVFGSLGALNGSFV